MSIEHHTFMIDQHLKAIKQGSAYRKRWLDWARLDRQRLKAGGSHHIETNLKQAIKQIWTNQRFIHESEKRLWSEIEKLSTEKALTLTAVEKRIAA